MYNVYELYIMWLDSEFEVKYMQLYLLFKRMSDLIRLIRMQL